MFNISLQLKASKRNVTIDYLLYRRQKLLQFRNIQIKHMPVCSRPIEVYDAICADIMLSVS